jgi:hypothetical protein
MHRFNVGDRVRVKNQCEGSGLKPYVLGRPAVVTRIDEGILAGKVEFVGPGGEIAAPQYSAYRIRISVDFPEQDIEHDVDESCLEPL